MSANDKSIHQFKVNDIEGKEVNLADYEGKVLMVVNTASKCGFTPQLDDMEDLYREFREEGFEILAFPSNDFAGQEPLEGKEIQQFCQIKYEASYPILEKVHVKGGKAHPVFNFLSKRSENGNVSSTPRWNFHKYLIDKEGQVRTFFYTFTRPNASKVKKAIRQLIEE
ncbi:MAG: glutathione peroxidase [Saprospiraceae bacterium]|nr:glutathione peroxidase [Saprospiraceae bacterium]